MNYIIQCIIDDTFEHSERKCSYERNIFYFLLLLERHLRTCIYVARLTFGSLDNFKDLFSIRSEIR